MLSQSASVCRWNFFGLKAAWGLGRVMNTAGALEPGLSTIAMIAVRIHVNLQKAQLPQWLKGFWRERGPPSLPPPAVVTVPWASTLACERGTTFQPHLPWKFNSGWSGLAAASTMWCPHDPEEVQPVTQSLTDCSGHHSDRIALPKGWTW